MSPFRLDVNEKNAHTCRRTKVKTNNHCICGLVCGGLNGSCFSYNQEL